MDSKSRELTKALGTLTGRLLVALAMIWFLPWASIEASSRLFNINIGHSVENYFYVWVLYILWVSLGKARSRSENLN